MFLDDQEGEAVPEREELPTGVITILTKCYSTTCSEEFPCYSYACPRKVCISISSLLYFRPPMFFVNRAIRCLEPWLEPRRRLRRLQGVNGLLALNEKFSSHYLRVKSIAKRMHFTHVVVYAGLNS